MMVLVKYRNGPARVLTTCFPMQVKYDPTRVNFNILLYLYCLQRNHAISNEKKNCLLNIDMQFIYFICFD